MNGDPQMEKRALIAIVLCLGILFMWQGVLFKRTPPATAPQEPVSQEPQPSLAERPVSEPRTEIRSKSTRELVSSEGIKDEKEVVFETDLYRVVLSTAGASIKSWQLKKYKTEVGPEGLPIEMVTQQNPALRPFTLGLELSDKDRGLLTYAIDEQGPNHITFYYRHAGLRIERSYEFSEGTYEFKHATRVWHEDSQITGNVYIGLSEGFSAEKSSILAPYGDVRNILYHTAEKTHRSKISKVNGDSSVREVIQWMGIENRYFVSAVINRASVNPYVLISKPLAGTGSVFLEYPFYRSKGKKFVEIAVSGYVGPKQVSRLKAVEPSFEEAVDFGIFSVICIPLLKIMNFFYYYCKNFGVAILLLTLLIRVLFHPLTKKSLVSMREMQRIQPQMAKVKEKFKEDRQQMNKEVMELMRANKVNPLGGCLPLLFQMPIFFALYRVLYNSIELYQAPFFWWIQDLSAKDPYFITPILMGVAMFFQQKLTPSASVDPMQKKMMMMMPLIFSFFMIALPSGLVIYILFSTLLQVVSQYMVNRELTVKAS